MGYSFPSPGHTCLDSNGGMKIIKSFWALPNAQGGSVCGVSQSIPNYLILHAHTSVGRSHHLTSNVFAEAAQVVEALHHTHTQVPRRMLQRAESQPPTLRGFPMWGQWVFPI